MTIAVFFGVVGDEVLSCTVLSLALRVTETYTAGRSNVRWLALWCENIVIEEYFGS